jgi:ribosomal protein S7
MAINTVKYNIIVSYTSGKYKVKRFRKVKYPIIERLTNSLIYHGRNNCKKFY